MIQFNVFPNGKKRVVTFSYDDGNKNDIRLVDIFNAHGVKATFHLNAMNHQNLTEAEKEEIRSLYKGHEIACHTFSHGWPARMPMISVINEVVKDRLVLEDIAGYPVVGMSYPSGSYNEDVITAMKCAGIVYSRTTKSTDNFPIPDDFMQWHPSCHHKNALSICDNFMEYLDSEWTHPIFYIWGHSHEFRCEDDWQVMEQILDKISGSDKIWYATNIEIYNYITAQRQLIVGANEKMFYNPASIDVWIEKDKKDIIKIPAGKTVTL